MTVAAWLLAALGLLLWPRSARASSREIRPVADQSRHDAGRTAARREALLAPVAGVGAAVVAVALGGIPGGVLAASAVGPATAFGVEWLRRRPRTSPPDRSLPLCLDLVAAVLRSGQPLAASLECAAPAAVADTEAALTRVARLLILGADPRQAWNVCAPPGSALEPVAAVAVRSQTSGLKLADAFERLATDLRADGAAVAAARANRAGVHAMGPLAACFLPSFVCLGIVPLVVGVAAAATRRLG